MGAEGESRLVGSSVPSFRAAAAAGDTPGCGLGDPRPAVVLGTDLAGSVGGMVVVVV